MLYSHSRKWFGSSVRCPGKEVTCESCINSLGVFILEFLSLGFFCLVWFDIFFLICLFD